MADYSEIQPQEIDPGSPMNTSLFSRLANNPIGIAEGDIDAPRLRLAAFSHPVAGDDFVAFFDPAEKENDEFVFKDIYRSGFLSASGSVRISLQIRSTFGTSVAQILVGGVVVISLSATGTVYTTRAADVNFLSGQGIAIQLRSPGGDARSGFVRNIQFSTTGEVLIPSPIDERYKI